MLPFLPSSPAYVPTSARGVFVFYKLCLLEDDSKKLGFYGVQSGMEVRRDPLVDRVTRLVHRWQGHVFFCYLPFRLARVYILARLEFYWSIRFCQTGNFLIIRISSLVTGVIYVARCLDISLLLSSYFSHFCLQMSNIRPSLFKSGCRFT